MSLDLLANVASTYKKIMVANNTLQPYNIKYKMSLNRNLYIDDIIILISQNNIKTKLRLTMFVEKGQNLKCTLCSPPDDPIKSFLYFPCTKKLKVNVNKFKQCEGFTKQGTRCNICTTSKYPPALALKNGSVYCSLHCNQIIY